MRSRLRYAARTLLGPWVALPALGLEMASFVLRGMPWRGEGLWTVEWFAIPLFILGPVCAGVAAIDAARLSRPGNIHLAVSVARPGWAYLRAAAWCAVPLACLHLGTIAAGLVIGQASQPSVSWWSLIAGALVQCLGIVWYVALGSAIGRYTSTVLAGLVAGTGAFVINYLIGGALTGEQRFQLLNLGSTTITMVGLSLNTGYLAAQAAMLVSTAAIFLTLRVQPRSNIRTPTIGSAVLIAAVVAMVVATPMTLPAHRYVAAPKPPTQCVGSAPQICMYPEHRRYSAIVRRTINTLAEAARSHGYPEFVPARVVEESRTYHPSGPGIFPLYLPADVYEAGRLPLEEAASMILNPTHCPSLQSPDLGGVDMDQFGLNYFSLLKTWLHLVGIDDVGGPFEPKLLSPEEVGAILDDFAHCRLDTRR